MTVAAGVAAVLAAVTVLLAMRPAGRALVRWRLGATHGARVASRPVRRVALLLLVAAVGGPTVVTLAGRPHLVVLGVTAAVVTWAALTLRARARAGAERRRRRQEVRDLCDALVADLTAGLGAPAALADVSTDWPIVAPAAAIARLGGDVPGALRAASVRPGAEHLAQVAAAWDVSQRCGAPLTGVLDQLAAALRDDDDARNGVVSELSSARATARLLAVLPLFGLLLGGGLGGRPWVVLGTTMIGALCLLAGSALAVAGVFWVERIADAAETA